MNRWRHLISGTLLLFSLNGRADPAADFADGQALGNARKGATVTGIKDGTAKATDPNYNTTAPQKSFFGNANLSAQTTRPSPWLTSSLAVEIRGQGRR